MVARKLLIDRGVTIDEAALQQAKNERYYEIFKPKSGSTLAMLGATFFGIFSGLLFWLLGFLIAVGILAYYYLGRKRDHQGRAYYEYGQGTRQTSKWLLIIVLGAFVLGLANILFFQLILFPDFDFQLWAW
ncbi:MAG: hypothetical protein AAFY41_12040 [Bacteroidota bacterium]